eukprot:565869_1
MTTLPDVEKPHVNDTNTTEHSDDDIPLSLGDMAFSLTRQKTNAAVNTNANAANSEDRLSDLAGPPLILKQVANAAKEDNTPLNMPPMLSRQSTDDTPRDHKSPSPDITPLTALARQQTDLHHEETQPNDAQPAMDDAFAALPQLNDISRQITDVAHDAKASALNVTYLPPRVPKEMQSDHRFFDDEEKELDLDKRSDLVRFIQNKTDESALDLISTAESLRRDTSVEATSRQKLVAAYEVAAIRAGDSELISWMCRTFEGTDVQEFVNGDNTLMQEIYATLLKSENETVKQVIVDDALCATTLPQLDDITRQTTDAAHHDVQSNNAYLDESLLMFDDKGKLLDVANEPFISLQNDDEEEEAIAIEDDSMNQFVEAKDAIICMAFNPVKEYQICCGGQDDRCYVWNAVDYDSSADEKKANNSYFAMTDHTDTVIDCAWNSTGKFLASASMDGTIQVYNCNKNMKLVCSLDIGDEIAFIEWHPNIQNEKKKWRNVLMAGALDKNVWIYEYNKASKQFESTQILSGHSGRMVCGGFTKYNNGKLCYSGDDDGVIMIWQNIVNNAFEGEKAYSFKPNTKNVTLYHESGVNVLDDCLMAPLLISGSCDHSVCLINYQNGKILSKLGKHEDSVECVQFHRTNKHYASSSSLDGCIKVWDLDQAKIRSELDHDDGVIVHAWFNTHSAANLIVSGTMNGMLYVWDSRNGKQIKQFKGHQKCSIQSIKISKDDKYIVSAADDHKAMVWSWN